MSDERKGGKGAKKEIQGAQTGEEFPSPEISQLTNVTSRDVSVVIFSSQCEE